MKQPGSANPERARRHALVAARPERHGRGMHRIAISILCLFAACAAPPAKPAPAKPAPPDKPALAGIVDQIRRADYRADLDALVRGHDALAPYPDPLARYWRAFALWRLGMNRTNAPGFDRALAGREFRACIDELAAITEPALAAEVKSSEAGCVIGAAYVTDDKPEQRALFARFAALLGDAIAAAPNNPRVLWMRGGQQMWTPPGDRAGAIATFERGLAIARAAPRVSDPLAPTWGEPELLMSLAFAYSTLEPVDYARADAYGRDALALQPDWAYVRDTLLPGIAAKRTGKSQ